MRRDAIRTALIWSVFLPWMALPAIWGQQQDAGEAQLLGRIAAIDARADGENVRLVDILREFRDLLKATKPGTAPDILARNSATALLLRDPSSSCDLSRVNKLKCFFEHLDDDEVHEMDDALEPFPGGYEVYRTVARAAAESNESKLAWVSYERFLSKTATLPENRQELVDFAMIAAKEQKPGEWLDLVRSMAESVARAGSVIDAITFLHQARSGYEKLSTQKGKRVKSDSILTGIGAAMAQALALKPPRTLPQRAEIAKFLDGLPRPEESIMADLLSAMTIQITWTATTGSAPKWSTKTSSGRIATTSTPPFTAIEMAWRGRDTRLNPFGLLHDPKLGPGKRIGTDGMANFSRVLMGIAAAFEDASLVAADANPQNVAPGKVFASDEYLETAIGFASAAVFYNPASGEAKLRCASLVGDRLARAPNEQELKDRMSKLQEWLLAQTSTPSPTLLRDLARVAYSRFDASTRLPPAHELEQARAALSILQLDDVKASAERQRKLTRLNEISLSVEGEFKRRCPPASGFKICPSVEGDTTIAGYVPAQQVNAVFVSVEDALKGRTRFRGISFPGSMAGSTEVGRFSLDLPFRLTGRHLPQATLFGGGGLALAANREMKTKRVGVFPADIPLWRPMRMYAKVGGEFFLFGWRNQRGDPAFWHASLTNDFVLRSPSKVVDTQSSFTEHRQWGFNAFVETRIESNVTTTVRGEGKCAGAKGTSLLNTCATPPRAGPVIEAGFYAPRIVKFAKLPFRGSESRGFIAPLVKAGMIGRWDDTPQKEVREGPFFYYVPGVRVGTLRTFYGGDSHNRPVAPILLTYFDIGYGRIGNLSLPASAAAPAFIPWKWYVSGNLAIPGVPLFFGFRYVEGTGLDDSRVFIGLRDEFNQTLRRSKPVLRFLMFKKK